MGLPSLRRLALADVGEEELAWIVRGEEHLFVERKQDLPAPPGFGAEIASFANGLGGWLLLGIADDGKVVGWDPGVRVDRQSHIGNLLRNEVDPVPPFIAAERELEGKSITVIRVLESADTPVLVRGTGALYIRDSGGKRPVDDHATLLALTQRGAEAEAEARRRLRELPIVFNALRPPDSPGYPSRPETLRVIVRASPLTVTPQFAAWPISGAVWLLDNAAMDLFGLPNNDRLVATVTPHGRGLDALHRDREDVYQRSLHLVADSGGVVAASLEEPANALDPEGLRTHFLRPLINVIADMLSRAEAIGRSAWDAWISPPTGDFEIPGAAADPRDVHCAGELTIPADDEDRAELARQWEREFARACGMASWEP
jgi:Putative DNA-binding domain